MKKILLIDDDEISLNAIESLLQRLEYTDVTSASDGMQALKLLDRMEHVFDVVITDVLMPEMDGFEIINDLLSRNFAGGVILISGGDIKIRHLAKIYAANINLNILTILNKPVTEHALVQALESLPDK